jgi:outer membrane murein-binding lipoprotein Lpp
MSADTETSINGGRGGSENGLGASAANQQPNKSWSSPWLYVIILAVLLLCGGFAAVEIANRASAIGYLKTRISSLQEDLTQAGNNAADTNKRINTAKEALGGVAILSAVGASDDCSRLAIFVASSDKFEMCRKANPPSAELPYLRSLLPPSDLKAVGRIVR